MKVQEYMLQALKDAVQMEVEGRQFYLDAAKKVKSAGVRQIMEYLAEDALALHKDVYRWKMKNLETLETLKVKVKMFNDNFEEFARQQKNLF